MTENNFFPLIVLQIVKGFDMEFFQIVFYGVFELPLLRNAQKRHKKISKKNPTYLI
jgi:hypothetical protein